MSYVHPKKHRKKKTGKRGKLLIAAVIALFMITSIMGFLGSNDSTGQISYGEYSFAQQPNGYTTKIDGETIFFYSNPFEVDRINVSAAALQEIRDAMVVIITFDPTVSDLQFMDQLRFELAEDLPKHFNTLVVPAVAEGNSSYVLPVLGCDNATTNLPVIHFAEGASTGSSYDNHCLVFEASSAQIHLRLKDRLLYGLFGIIE